MTCNIWFKKKIVINIFKIPFFLLENWQILFVFKNSVTTMYTSQTLLTKALVQKEVEIDEGRMSIQFANY